MGLFDAGGGRFAAFDGGNEIGPEEREVMSIGLLQLRIFVDGRGALARGIKRPAIRQPMWSIPLVP